MSKLLIYINSANNTHMKDTDDILVEKAEMVLGGVKRDIMFFGTKNINIPYCFKIIHFSRNDQKWFFLWIKVQTIDGEILFLTQLERDCGDTPCVSIETVNGLYHIINKEYTEIKAFILGHKNNSWRFPNLTNFRI